jgi:xanthine dehydrogenase accessory factor
MREIADILRAMQELEERGEPVALATIVSARGSTYRREGARLLVPRDGETVGNLSGGCLEGDVAETARRVIEDGRPQLLQFDLTTEDEAVWGWGLGCNGAIDVYVERADAASSGVAALARAAAESRPLAVVTVIDSAVADARQGLRMVVDADEAAGSTGDGELDRVALELARDALAVGRSASHDVTMAGQGTGLFVEVLRPPLRLLVCGAGHDAIPVVRQAATLGWQVEVVDERRSLLDDRRFPEAAGFHHLDRPHEAAGAASIDGRTYVVVMSHNYVRDLDYLRSFLASEVPYIGMLGPKSRTEQLYADLERDGVTITDADRVRVHAPIGLDLGAEGPEEVAVSIVAEVLAVSRARAAGHLRDRSGPIHAPVSAST